jgi:hypothetical protein
MMMVCGQPMLTAVCEPGALFDAPRRWSQSLMGDEVPSSIVKVLFFNDKVAPASCST